MVWQSVRLSKQEKAKLEEMAERNGMTVSGMIRELIRTGHERNAVNDALQEIRVAIGNLAAQKSGTGNEDIAEMRRIVTLIAKAMPSVAKHV